jgi:hypothetical protein
MFFCCSLSVNSPVRLSPLGGEVAERDGRGGARTTRDSLANNRARTATPSTSHPSPVPTALAAPATPAVPSAPAASSAPAVLRAAPLASSRMDEARGTWGSDDDDDDDTLPAPTLALTPTTAAAPTRSAAGRGAARGPRGKGKGHFGQAGQARSNRSSH